MDLISLLDEFRKQEYHYPDVIWHDIRTIRLKSLFTEKLAEMTQDEFKDILSSHLFMPARLRKECFGHLRK